MRKTVFLSESRNAVKGKSDWKIASYIFYDRKSKKWRQDEWYYQDLSEIKADARKQGYLIK